jgi:hypothetical protein
LVPGFNGFELFEGAAFLGKDFDGALGPHVRLGAGVVVQQVVLDRLFQLGDAGERAAPDALAGDLGEETLDEVQPDRLRL